MKQRIGICTNFGNCEVADNKQKVPITGGEDYCPTCGSQLTTYRTSRSRLVPIGGGIIILLLGIIGLWQFLRPSISTPQPLLSPISCLEGQKLFAQQLPLSYVPAISQHPIPGDLSIWMRGVQQITAPAFSIMRREVSVGDFKNYVETLSY